MSDPVSDEWIKMRHDLQHDKEVIGIAKRLGTTEFHVIGMLHKIWSWADMQLVDGNADSVTFSWIDRYIGVTGFAQAMSSEGWLDPKGDEGCDGVVFPEWNEHFSQSAKKRAVTAKRVKRHRNKSNDECNAQCNDVSVTPSSSSSSSVINSSLKGESEGKGKKSKPDSGDLLFPDPLNNDRFKAALDAWVGYRKKIRKPLTQDSIEAILKEWEKRPIEEFEDAVQFTKSKGWQGLAERNDNGRSGTGKSNVNRGQQFDPERKDVGDI
jgi:hypothetical protein